MATATFKQTAQATRFECVVNMETKMRKKFIGLDGKIFVVEEVVQTPAGLTVFYINEATQQKYSCLIDAFSERFKPIEDSK